MEFQEMRSGGWWGIGKTEVGTGGGRKMLLGLN